MFKNLFSLHKSPDEDFFDDLLDALIEGDIGAKNSMEIVDTLQSLCKEGKIHGEQAIVDKLKELLDESGIGAIAVYKYNLNLTKPKE